MWLVAGVSEDLCFEFRYGHDLVTADVLPVLQLVLAEVAPRSPRRWRCTLTSVTPNGGAST
jgi:hypothetical protein